jgi:hypothetical protein
MRVGFWRGNTLYVVKEINLIENQKVGDKQKSIAVILLALP